MSSSRTSTLFPPRPSPFAKLPLELVKQIVNEVHEQDAFKKSDIERSEAALGQLDSDEEDEEGADVARGVWGAPYGRGTHSLSLASRTLRELCLPYLFEVRPPFFPFHLLRLMFFLCSDCWDGATRGRLLPLPAPRIASL
jgi:hypothetical protein